MESGTGSVDAAGAWLETYERVTALVEDVGADRMEQQVPACPDWTGRQLLSHMIGLDADSMDGDEPDDHNESWTQAQVDARADRSVEELLQEWADIAARLPDWMREVSARPLGDAVIHEQDLRGGLGRPGGRDSAGVAMIRERIADRFGESLDGLPPIALVGESWSWCSAGDADDAAVVVRASDFDLFRAVTSRRTADQLRGWTERVDVDPYLDALGGLGPLPDQPLPE